MAEVCKKVLSYGTNDLCRLFESVSDGDTIVLEKDKIYDVWQDDAVWLKGYYCSNTAEIELNPDGERKVAIFLKGKKNVTIDGNGATIMIHGVMTPLLFDKCENLLVENLKIDYFRPTESEFKILSNNNGECVIKIAKESLYEIADDGIVWVSEKDRNGKYFWSYKYKDPNILSMFFNTETEENKYMPKEEGDIRPSVPAFKVVEKIDDTTLRIRLNDPKALFNEGDVIQSRCILRNQVGSFCNQCKNVYYYNLKIMAMHGLGILSQYCENVTLSNLDCTPKEGRVLASNADFFHFSGCKGKILIENCKACGAHDDFVNVHGTHLRIVGKDEKDKSVTLRFMNVQTWGFDAFYPKDNVEFIKGKTLQPYAKAKVVKTERISDTEVKLYLNKMPSEIKLNEDAIENATWTPSLTVRNNFFGPSCGRGILCTTRKKVLIEGNIFYKNGGSVLCVEDDCNFWFESGYTKDVEFRYNVIVSSAYGVSPSRDKNAPIPPVISISPKVLDENFNGYVHDKIVIKNNTFKCPVFKKNVLSVNYVNKFKLVNNSFDGEGKMNVYNVKSLTQKANKTV